jgi:hypothetical protein
MILPQTVLTLQSYEVTVRWIYGIIRLYLFPEIVVHYIMQ